MAEEFGAGGYVVSSLLEPFEEKVTFGEITDVLNETTLHNVLRDVESIPVEPVSNDLSRFQQSENLDEPCQEQNLSPTMRQLVHFFKTKVRNTVEQIYGIESEEQITLTISKYTKGDYLLCHDDMLGRRAVAFVLYLNDLTEHDGGHLRFFDHNEYDEPISNSYSRTMKPVCNTLVLFRVTRKSHHEVEQMFTDSVRISINGWFLCESSDVYDENDVIIFKPVGKAEITKFLMNTYPIMNTNEIVGDALGEQMTNRLKNLLVTTKEAKVTAMDFLDEQFYRNCVLELETYDLQWETKGPANYRCYETLPFEVEGPHISFGESLYCIGNLVDLLTSPAFLQKLTEITGAEYAVLYERCVPPSCMIEVQRWKEGNYSVLSDINVERETPSVEVSVYFSVNSEMFGSGIGTDLSGLVVQSTSTPLLTREAQKTLSDVKLQRMQKAWTKSLASEKCSVQRKEKFMKSVESPSRMIVEQKINRLKEYRRSRKAEVSYLQPKSNSLCISYGSKNITKYISYIKKRSPFGEADTCFYAVNITYFTM